MAIGYAIRDEVQELNRPDVGKWELTKTIEANSPHNLELAVNLFLLALPLAIVPSVPHVVDIQYQFYSLTGGPQPRERFVAHIHLYLALIESDPGPLVATIEGL